MLLYSHHWSSKGSPASGHIQRKTNGIKLEQWKIYIVHILVYRCEMSDNKTLIIENITVTLQHQIHDFMYVKRYILKKIDWLTCLYVFIVLWCSIYYGYYGYWFHGYLGINGPLMAHCSITIIGTIKDHQYLAMVPYEIQKK